MKPSLWVAFTLFGYWLVTVANAQQTPSTVAKIDEYLTAAADLHHLNGTVLIAQKGSVLLQKGYGWRNKSAKIPNEVTFFAFQRG